MLYFDHNATAPMLPAAREAWLEATERYIGNPSSPHRLGDRADRALGEAREQVAAWLGCHALDIVWTSGATEAANMVFHHLRESTGEGAGVAVSAIEHPCVLEASARSFGERRELIPVSRAGVVELDAVSDLSRRDAAGAVAVMAANNETGVLQPWSDCARIGRERDIPFFCDATQWIGRLPAGGLGECDFVTGSAHKFGGPRGVGFLKCPARTGFVPLLRGGAQEHGRRAGTENVPGVLAMIRAWELREAAIAAGEAGPRAEWRDRFATELVRSLPGTTIVGGDAPHLWNTVSALMPEADCRQRWVVKLDKAGFAVSTGSACASGKESPSHVLTAMGFRAAEAGRALRFSAGWQTTEADWRELLAGVVKVAREMQQAAGQQ